MGMDFDSFLEQKGYEIGTDGAKYFSMLLEEVVYALSTGISKEEVKNKIIGVTEEYYYRFFRVSKKEYFRKLNKFCNSRLVKEGKINKQEDLETTLLHLAKKYIKENPEENKKTYQKCKKK